MKSQTYEGGYGQTPEGESLGGPTYCALASLYLVPTDHACAAQARLQRAEWHATVRWLLQMQVEALASVGGGGFAGRTNKLADACYGFWCGAALSVRAGTCTQYTTDISLAVFLFCFVPCGDPHFVEIRSLALAICSMRTR
jgi:prenyltransferase beta subunit